MPAPIYPCRPSELLRPFRCDEEPHVACNGHGRFVQCKKAAATLTDRSSFPSGRLALAWSPGCLVHSLCAVPVSAAAYLSSCVRVRRLVATEIAPMRYPPLRRVSGRRSRSSSATWRSSKQAWPASRPASKHPQSMTTRTSRQRRPPPRRRGRPRQPSRACRRTCAFCPRARSTHSGRSSRTLPRV